MNVYQTNSDIRWLVIYPHDNEYEVTVPELLRRLAAELEERDLGLHVTNIELIWDDDCNPAVMALTETEHKK